MNQSLKPRMTVDMPLPAAFSRHEFDGHEAQPSHVSDTAFVIRVALIASLGGILFGYDLGVVSGALPQLEEEFSLKHHQSEWVVSILYLGGGLGACIGGSLCDALGRRQAILFTDAVFVLGAVLLYAAHSLPMIYVGRFVVGIAVAVSGIADVSYLHEMAPPEYRGAMVSVNEACISAGFLLAFLVAYCYANVTDGWRSMFGWSGVLAIVQGMGMWQMPESTQWLAEQRQRRSVYNDLEQQQGQQHPNSHHAHELPTQQHSGVILTNYQSMVLARKSAVLNNADDEASSWWTRTRHACGFIWKEYYRQAIIALFLAIVQQFCGQTIVLSYTPLLLAQAVGSDNSLAKVATIWIGIVKFVITVLVIWKIESLGRRFLLLSGMALIAVGLIGLAAAYGSADDVAVGLALAGSLAVVAGYSLSFGPLTWLLTSELFPTEIRGRALGVSTIVTYLAAALVTRSFLSLQALLGASFVFGGYAVLTTAGLVFAAGAIPDTSVADVSWALDRMVLWRSLVW